MGKTFSALPITALLAAGPAQGFAEEWRLMGRHGGCQSLADAAKRKDALNGVSGLGDFAAKMGKQGETVKNIEIPGRGLSLIFMPAKECRKR